MYLKANRRFKFEVVKAAQAPVLFDLIESLWIRIGPLMQYYAHDMKYQGETDRYFEVVEALQNRDAKKAQEHMCKDVIDGAKFLREVAVFASESKP